MLQKGATVHIKDNGGMTAYDYAVKAEDSRLVDMLQKAGYVDRATGDTQKNVNPQEQFISGYKALAPD